MSYKVRVSRKLVNTSIKLDNVQDPKDGIKIKINFKLVPELQEWLEMRCPEIPPIQMTYHDFEPSEYYIRLPTEELKTQFEITWY